LLKIDPIPALRILLEVINVPLCSSAVAQDLASLKDRVVELRQEGGRQEWLDVYGRAKNLVARLQTVVAETLAAHESQPKPPQTFGASTGASSESLREVDGLLRKFSRAITEAANDWKERLARQAIQIDDLESKALRDLEVDSSLGTHHLVVKINDDSQQALARYHQHLLEEWQKQTSETVPERIKIEEDRFLCKLNGLGDCWGCAPFSVLSFSDIEPTPPIEFDNTVSTVKIPSQIGAFGHYVAGATSRIMIMTMYVGAIVGGLFFGNGKTAGYLSLAQRAPLAIALLALVSLPLLYLASRLRENETKAALEREREKLRSAVAGQLKMSLGRHRDRLVRSTTRYFRNLLRDFEDWGERVQKTARDKTRTDQQVQQVAGSATPTIQPADLARLKMISIQLQQQILPPLEKRIADLSQEA